MSLVWRCLRDVFFFRHRVWEYDVDGNNEGLVVEHASFSCSAPGCKYISQWKANVRRHEKQHNNIVAPSQADLSAREFICEHCGSSFTRLSSLNKHRNMKHTETFRFTCERCNRGFIQLWAYRGHLASHDITKSIFRYHKMSLIFESQIRFLISQNRICDNTNSSAYCDIKIDLVI